MKIQGLEGDYCQDCIESLTKHRLAVHAIIPMCRQDLDTFLHNGDIYRASKYVMAGARQKSL